LTCHAEISTKGNGIRAAASLSAAAFRREVRCGLSSRCSGRIGMAGRRIRCRHSPAGKLPRTIQAAAHLVAGDPLPRRRCPSGTLGVELVAAECGMAASSSQPVTRPPHTSLAGAVDRSNSSPPWFAP
jgi:hypothetical protein